MTALTHATSTQNVAVVCASSGMRWVLILQGEVCPDPSGVLELVTQGTQRHLAAAAKHLVWLIVHHTGGGAAVQLGVACWKTAWEYATQSEPIRAHAANRRWAFVVRVK